MVDNYKSFIELISRTSGVPVEELEKRVEAKQTKLSGLISKEGAAQVIAAELGINLDKEIIKISQINPGMRKINIVGKIMTLFPVKEYNKNGRSGKIGAFILADETSNIRTVLWDENHIELISTQTIAEGSVVEIANASIRNGELHLGSFSEIKLSTQKIGEIVTKKPVSEKKIRDFLPNENVSTRAFIVQIFDPKFFEVCPECKKKVVDGKCATHGAVVSQRRALLNFVIDDGTDSIRAVMFSDQLEKIMNLEELNDPELLASRKRDLLGKELIISGNVRQNQLYGTSELIISGVEEIDLDKLLISLQK